MKKLLNFFLLLIVINAGILVTPAPAPAQGRAVNFQVFYDNLSPYGTWFQSPAYGYVWRPNVSQGFYPYSTNGYWAYTDVGWAWVSDYDWGWAPFHYGRWYYDSSYGYVWVPDYDWGPGWVTWRRSDDYYGWAPIGPGVNINLAYSSGYNIPYNYWRFVRCNDLGRRNINNYYINTTNNTTIINNTTVINNTRVDNTRNTRYAVGPDKVEVEKRTGKPVNTVAIKDESTPVQKANEKELHLYRPVIDKNTTPGVIPAPTKLGNREIVKPQQKNDATTPIIKIPATTAPVKEETTQPVKQPPVKQPPIREQNNNQPPKQEPVKQQPIREQNNNQPPKQQPVQQQPVREQPIREQPVKEQPNNQPVREEPIIQPPVREQNNNQPVKEEPIKQQPVREQSIPQKNRKD